MAEEKQYETKPNTGVVFKNDKKLTDKHPDYTGNAQIEINGQSSKMYISMWVKEGKEGKKYFSVSFSPPNFDKANSNTVAPQIKPPVDDDLPF